MNRFVPERFAPVRTLREDRHSKTFLADDHFLDREKVVVRIIRKDYIGRHGDDLIDHLSWLVGVEQPQLANVLDVGMTKQQHLYYVREYLPPSELSSVDFNVKMKFLVSVVDFLSIHGRVHGAIKLSNMFANAGILKLTDAVVSRKIAVDEASVHFVAPEILLGGDTSHEGDLYSIGAVLYYELTGRHLFEDYDLIRLRSKYLSAFPQPAQCLPGISRPLSEALLELLSKNPQKRTAAFEHIKRAIDARIVPADRGPFVNREICLEEAVQTVERRSKSLRILLVEGERGTGKSRFIAELRLRCLPRGSVFVPWRCTNDADTLTPIRQGLRKLLRSEIYPFHTNVEKLLTVLSDHQAQTSHAKEKTNILEKIVSDLIFLLSLIARRLPLVLTIEDVHLSGAETVLFLRQLALRAAEVPLTLVLTQQSGQIESNWIGVIKDCLNSDFLRLQLTPLSRLDAEKLVRFLEDDRERQLEVAKLSAGNPLLIHEYVKYRDPFDSVPAQIADAAASMISPLTKDTRRVLQVLSIFRNAINIQILATLCEKQPSDLEPHLHSAETLGIINRSAEVVEIRLPIVRAELQKLLARSIKLRLNRQAFCALKETESDLEALAEYAFKGRIFEEAGSLYRALAKKAYASQKYRAAVVYYQRARRCDVDILEVSDKLNMARSYEWLGRYRLARRVYEHLRTAESVQHDPELLSALYVRLAVALYKTSKNERIHFQELAIRCLPANSLHLSRRYAEFCIVCLRAGDLVRADHAFRKAEECVLRLNEDISLLNCVRALLLMNGGDFRGGLSALLSSTASDPEKSTVSINLSFCLERLGELRTALTHLLRTEESFTGDGNIPFHALLINNRAAIKTKLGEMVEAQRLFSQAYDLVRRFQSRGSFGQSGLTIIAADSALHNIYLGNYRRAADCLKKASVLDELLLEADRICCKTVRCKFLIEIGLSQKAYQLLRSFSGLSIFNTDFFQIERALIESRLPEIPAQEKLHRLQQGLLQSRRLGTLYQGCEVLVSLASVFLELGERQKAEDYAGEALEVANNSGYKILAAQSLLYCALATDRALEKRHFLSDSFQLASEMGLQELIAEAAYHLGIFNFESGNIVTAREYLIRSASITARLADEVPTAARTKYLAKTWRRDAVRALEKCNAAMPLDPAAVFNADADRYFSAAYQFTMAAATANSVEGLLNSINKVLTTSSTRSALITLKGPGFSNSIPVRIKSSPELAEHIELIRNHAKNRVYFESADGKGKPVSAWIPLKSETTEGGIYLTCRSHESQFTEKEIELLTMMGAIGSSALKRLETRQAQEIESRELAEFHGIIGASKHIRDVFSQIQIAAGNTATVLIEGESGTGKELVAKAIHAAGPRAKHPFVPVDCGAIPEALVEAELFGSKKGSYTGAVTDRPGLFEAADRGTIFLDEISNTTTALQAKLLRVIQEREVRRIGETKGRTIDARLIVASNQSLDALAEGGQFRKDLLYRLKVLHIKVPPLRTRRDDIPMLAHTFLQKLNASAKTKKYFAAGVVERLVLHEFPGNVRELQNAVERAFFLSSGIMITEIPLAVNTPTVPASAEEVQVWFKDLSEGRKDFWSAIHNRYKRRDISREKVVALVDFGLRATRGSYTTMASMFRLKQKDYRRFMDFLRRNDCLLDFRPYRKAAAASREN